MSITNGIPRTKVPDKDVKPKALCGSFGKSKPTSSTASRSICHKRKLENVMLG